MAADPVVSPADTIRRAVECAQGIQSAWDAESGGMFEYQWEHLGDAERDFRSLVPGVFALLAVGERDKAEIEALKAEVERLADRAVCSGCGSDVGESGVCTYDNCCEDFSCEMIPASDLPHALMVLCDRRVEERDEWRSDWEALRAEAKALEVAGERDRRHIARLTEALERIADPMAANVWRAQYRADALRGIARAVLAGEEDAANG